MIEARLNGKPEEIDRLITLMRGSVRVEPTSGKRPSRYGGGDVLMNVVIEDRQPEQQPAADPGEL